MSSYAKLPANTVLEAAKKTADYYCRRNAEERYSAELDLVERMNKWKKYFPFLPKVSIDQDLENLPLSDLDRFALRTAQCMYKEEIERSLALEQLAKRALDNEVICSAEDVSLLSIFLRTS